MEWETNVYGRPESEFYIEEHQYHEKKVHARVRLSKNEHGCYVIVGKYEVPGRHCPKFFIVSEEYDEAVLRRDEAKGLLEEIARNA